MHFLQSYLCLPMLHFNLQCPISQTASRFCCSVAVLINPATSTIINTYTPETKCKVRDKLNAKNQLKYNFTYCINLS